MNVVCVNWKNYAGRGTEYVNVLKDMVSRNLAADHNFICYTDDPAGLECETRPLPGDLEGWWNKLFLFDKERGKTLFLDLDTLIVGNLDHLLSYDGKLAILRDFYRRTGYGSGVMLWNGDHSYIWRDWLKAGKPIHPLGDQGWMEKYKADILQDLYPGNIASYKQHSREGIPNGAKVVCFHGLPRPHELPSEWVKEVWKIGGLTEPKFFNSVNNSVETMLTQFKENLKRDLPWFAGSKERKDAALIVGGGPSLRDNLTQLRFRISRGGEVFALNGVHDFLIERGIIPGYMVMLDSRQDNVKFIAKPRKDVKYLISAFCHPDVFEALEGFDVTLWMSDMDGVMPIVKDIHDKPVCLVGGGATVGMKTMYLCYLMGYRKFNFFGFDSSYRGDNNHAYSQPLNDKERRIEVTAAGKKFICAHWMAKQAMEFQKQARQLADLGCNLTVHGDGLIPWVMQNWRA